MNYEFTTTFLLLLLLLLLSHMQLVLSFILPNSSFVQNNLRKALLKLTK